jgi:hypothetical protein
LSDSKVKGLSHQQYVIASAVRVILSSILSNMQMELSGAGAGKPKRRRSRNAITRYNYQTARTGRQD